jgi:hypothetical protein
MVASIPVAGFRQEDKGGEEVLMAWKGKKGEMGGKEQAAMAQGAFKAAWQGGQRRGGGPVRDDARRRGGGGGA